MSKNKYTIYLKHNNSRIVLTDSENDTEEEIITNIENLMNSTETKVFQTKTDLVFIKPSNIEAIHVTLEDINLENDESDSFLEDDLEEDIYKDKLEEVRKEVLDDVDEVSDLYEEEESFEEDGEELNEDLLKDFDTNFEEQVDDEELLESEEEVKEKKEDLDVNDNDS